MRIDRKNWNKTISQIRSFRRKKSQPVSRFLEAVVESSQLESFVAKKNGKKSVKELAKKNFIINSITSLEVYFKELIQVKANIWNAEGLDDLLKDKITLSEAFELFSKYSPTKADIVSHHYSFQSIQSIENVFSKLIGGAFLSSVGSYKFNVRGPMKEVYNKTELILDIDIPNWKTTLSEIYDLRHQLVHESSHKHEIVIDMMSFGHFIITLGIIIWYFLDFKNFNSR